jgi:hypothetical protein
MPQSLIEESTNGVSNEAFAPNKDNQRVLATAFKSILLTGTTIVAYFVQSAPSLVLLLFYQEKDSW